MPNHFDAAEGLFGPESDDESGNPKGESQTQRAVELVSDHASLMEDDHDIWDPTPALVDEVPAIPGLYFPPVRLPEDYAESLVPDILQYFNGDTMNQVMLFGSSSSGLPSFILGLINELSILLEGHLQPSTHQLLFPTTSEDQRYPARQVIFNLYRPGEGISPHIDLVRRFGDGIIVVSLVSGIVMDFLPEEGASSSIPIALWLPPCSILVLEREARYQWKHGIRTTKQDFIQNRNEEGGIDGVWVDRRMRVSCTIRWLLLGAEQLGPS